MQTIAPKGEGTITPGLRLPHSWVNQIDYLAELQNLTRSQQLRELIRFGGEHVGLELE
jgi:hypothetical protein